VVLVVVVGVVAAWLAIALLTAQGADSHEFRKTTTQAAQGALDAVQTARLAGEAERDQHAFQVYVLPVLQNSQQGIGTALQRMGEQPASGEAERRLRDELFGLLHEADRHTGDLTAAVERGDREGINTAVRWLGPVGDRLTAFVVSHRE
jgi:type II secretory pathway pseudopilin PulG